MDPQPSGDAIVVHENARKVDVLFGFLTAAFLLALWRGHMGAETDTGRLVGDVLFGALTIGTIALWRMLKRRPARLEISQDSIVLAHRGGKRTQVLPRSGGELSIRMAGGRYPQPYLCTDGSEERVLLSTFDRKEVANACLATGWRFVD